jgi:hypothetical protein
MIKFERTVDYKTGEKETVVVGVGTTLYVETRCEQVMSDIWEMLQSVYYWDSEAKSVRSYYTGKDVEYTVDADFDKVYNEMRSTFYEINLNRFKREADCESFKTHIKGRTVKVTKGRNGKGSVGKVVFVKEMMYNMGYRGTIQNKLCIALDDEMTTYVAGNGKTYPTHANTIWVWAFNCEVVNPEADYAQAEERAKQSTEYDIRAIKGHVDGCEWRRYQKNRVAVAA